MADGVSGSVTRKWLGVRRDGWRSGRREVLFGIRHEAIVAARVAKVVGMTGVLVRAAARCRRVDGHAADGVFLGFGHELSRRAGARSITPNLASLPAQDRHQLGDGDLGFGVGGEQAQRIGRKLAPNVARTPEHAQKQP